MQLKKLWQFHVHIGCNEYRSANFINSNTEILDMYKIIANKMLKLEVHSVISNCVKRCEFAATNVLGTSFDTVNVVIN